MNKFSQPGQLCGLDLLGWRVNGQPQPDPPFNLYYEERDRAITAHPIKQSPFISKSTDPILRVPLRSKSQASNPSQVSSPGHVPGSSSSHVPGSSPSRVPSSSPSHVSSPSHSQAPSHSHASRPSHNQSSRPSHASSPSHSHASSPSHSHSSSTSSSPSSSPCCPSSSQSSRS
ncbi:hypothetical protein AMELA_G00267290 [Ameiurus melas]|uniref:Uncharacterized protein n=1 Tax=Ameiurus melas TaxID=219545 RepID=A0A7J5ZMV3_AMEME|nr:hypothetical protein AMELA_G00267290 [Ameiurus melas]